jgi:hypothetical protein
MSMNFRKTFEQTPLSRDTAGKRSRPRRLRACDRGSMGVMAAAVVVPLLVGFGTLTIGEGYYSYRALLLKQTVQAAGLAAGNKLGTFYTYPTTDTVAQRSVDIVTAAQTFAAKNMPTAQYGTVVPSSNVVLGNWNSTTSTFTTLAASGGTAPDSVQVTGYNTASNGNPIALFLGNWFGKPTADATTKVIASNGNGQPFNVIVVNDLSMSFVSEISNQRAADLAILNCVKGQAGTSSVFGLTAFTGHTTTPIPLTVANTNYTAIQTEINALADCGSPGMPVCSGSNVAAGLNSAIQQFSSAAYNNTRKNIVVITDGIPNASSTIYSPADGITACTTNCQDSDLQAAAQSLAATAGASGIAISTIFYSGESGQTAQDIATAKTYLGSLVTGTGLAMVAPTPAQISATIAGFCATMPSSLKVIM